MEYNINKVSQEVVDHFREDFKWELDVIDYGYIKVYEDDVDTEEHLIQSSEGWNASERITHRAYKGQDYIVVVVDPQA